MNVFTGTFNQFNVSLLNKSLNVFYYFHFLTLNLRMVVYFLLLIMLCLAGSQLSSRGRAVVFGIHHLC